MKAGMKTVLRSAAWSTSVLLVIGAAAGTANAVTHHTKHPGKAGTGAATRPHLLHDLATVRATDGRFEEYATQVGTVSAVSDTSITVVSADEYSATYVVDDGTKVFKKGAKAAVGEVAEGDTVFVRAEDEDGTFTAGVIGDGRPPAGRGHGPGGHGGPGGPGGPGAPGASGSGV